MLMPKRVKHRKQHRGRMTGVASRGQFVEFGDQGLMATESAWITDRQIESARVALTRFTKKGGRVWIRIFPDHPSTKKPAETRMGKGKGAPDHWVAVIKPGRVMFEIGGIPAESAKKALSMASHKLPIKTKIVERDRTIKVI